MHVPQVWYDGKSSFCIVPNSGIWRKNTPHISEISWLWLSGDHNGADLGCPTPQQCKILFNPVQTYCSNLLPTLQLCQLDVTEQPSLESLLKLASPRVNFSLLSEKESVKTKTTSAGYWVDTVAGLEAAERSNHKSISQRSLLKSSCKSSYKEIKMALYIIFHASTTSLNLERT